MHTLEAVCIFVHSLSFSEQLFCKLGPAQFLQAGPAQDVMPLRIHQDKMFVSGEAWRLFK
jgi:hypothetical protein